MGCLSTARTEFRLHLASQVVALKAEERLVLEGLLSPDKSSAQAAGEMIWLLALKC